MDNDAQKSGDRAQTRARLVDVFNRLLLEQDELRPRVADIIAEAGVARSTFYDHFDGIEALYDESLSMLLDGLAHCLADPEARPRLPGLLAHIWENRTKGRELLSGPRGERAEAQLARLIEARIDQRGDRRLVAILSAGTLISALVGWLGGRVSATPEQLAERITLSHDALLALPE